LNYVELGSLGFLVLVYGLSGLAELFTWKKMIDQFTKWGYPRWMPLFNAFLKLAAGLLLMIPTTRTIGIAICFLVGFAAVATVLKNNDKSMLKAAFPVFILTTIAGYFLLTKVTF